MDQTVKKQKISDVKLGAFLSGGIDSSTIVASMCKSDKQDQVNAFCVGFKEKIIVRLSKVNIYLIFLILKTFL